MISWGIDVWGSDPWSPTNSEPPGIPSAPRGTITDDNEPSGSIIDIDTPTGTIEDV